MKRYIITGIVIITCVALCNVVWLRNAEIGDSPEKPVKNAVAAEIEPRTEEMAEIFLYDGNPTHQIEAATESELSKTEITAEEKTESSPPADPTFRAVSKPTPNSIVPKPGTIAVIDGIKSMWIPGFGWVKDEGGGSVIIHVGSEGDINRQVGIIGGGTVVGNPSDKLTGNKAGIMGEGTVAKDMYENGHKIGIMGSEESLSHETTSPTSEQPKQTGGVIYIELQPTPTKDITPPPYKPGEDPSNP
ncbi:DUF6550 family protein [Dehalobacter restrictus]|uniref:Uncharacterized protein n=1 Tax=Dehalobacter restrictus TaxID=55583 RepID=A0A857DL62_9FIRM|nr:DUF6550 family protein [Dehalobacter restrictus]QHA01461.1 hypothetical protein GQ588_12825 [Dehalobacter restrictus]